MIALKICKTIMEQLNSQESICASVHSVFKNAINLDVSGKELITVIGSQKQMAPRSIAISSNHEIDFLEFNISQGMQFVVTHDFIYSDAIFITMKNPEIWNPEPNFTFKPMDKENVLNNLNILNKFVKRNGKHYGIEPVLAKVSTMMPELELNIYSKYRVDESLNFIAMRVKNFIDLIRKEDLKEISKAAKKIIGFGTGLTPAMDDFLCGMMISLVYLYKIYLNRVEEAYQINAQIIKDALGSTTRVSAEMLKLASIGQVAENASNLLISILSEKEEERWIGNLKKALDFGDTSGTDTVFGVYTGLKLLSNKF